MLLASETQDMDSGRKEKEKRLELSYWLRSVHL